MNYINGQMIKELREKQKLTQRELAEQLMVSDKTISKWETGKGLPDIGILEDLLRTLSVSVAELLMGEYKINDNISANMRKIHFYVCPVCGNVITSIGAGAYSCCGITLPEIQVEPAATVKMGEVNAAMPEQSPELHQHTICVETIDNEYSVTMNHPMKKNHYISFLAYVTSDHVELVKQYPEQDISVRFRKRGNGMLYAYCNRHGMYGMRI